MNAIAAFVAAGIVTRVGYLVRVPDPSKGMVNLITFCQDRCAEWMHHLSAALQSVWPALAQRIDSPGMTSLTYSIGYVLVILLLMSVLYVSKVFVKV